MKNFLGCLWPRRHTRPVRPSIPGVSSSIAAYRHSAIAFITGIDCNYYSADDRSELEHDDTVSGSSFQPPTSSFGIGIIIYPSLLLTTHNTLPSVEALQNAEIVLRYSATSLNTLRRKFLPHLFFITDAELNLTVVACEHVSPEMNPMGLDMTTYNGRTLEIGSKVYVMGYDTRKSGTSFIVDQTPSTESHQSAATSTSSTIASAVSGNRQSKSVSISLTGQPAVAASSRRLSVGSGYVVGAYAHPTRSGSHDTISAGRGRTLTSLIDIRTREEIWCEGSAGFNEEGNFSFIVTHINCNNCDSGMSSPQSPASTSSNIVNNSIVRSSTSPTTFTALTLPSIRQWLEPQWRASLNPSSPRQFLSFSITQSPNSNIYRNSTPVQSRSSNYGAEQYHNPSPNPNPNSSRTSRSSGSVLKITDVKSNMSIPSSSSSDRSTEQPNYQKLTASASISAAARRKSRPSGSSSPINTICNHPHHENGRCCRGSNPANQLPHQTPRQSRLAANAVNPNLNPSPNPNPPSPTRPSMPRVQLQDDRESRPSILRVQLQDDRESRPSVPRVQLQDDRESRPSMPRVVLPDDIRERRVSVPLAVHEERERRSVPQLKLTDFDI